MATTQYYVDYGAGDDTTGNGTISTPWKTIQKALDTITRDATNGDQINVKAGTAQVLAAALTLATYGTPGATSQLVVRGYTATANDGGQAEINCGGYTMWASAYNYTSLIDLQIHTPGDNVVVALGVEVLLARCDIHKGASTISGSKYLASVNGGLIANCQFRDTTQRGLSAGMALVTGCYFRNISGIVLLAGTVTNCLFSISATGAYCQATGVPFWVGNSFYSSVANTQQALTVAVRIGIVANNIVVGFSGAGGKGILLSGLPHVVGANAFYNNTANYVGIGLAIVDLSASDVTLAADPFTDAANGDFSLTTAAKAALRSAGWPQSYLGAHANSDPHATIGAVQYGAAEAGGGGGGPVVGSRIIRGLGAI